MAEDIFEELKQAFEQIKELSKQVDNIPKMQIALNKLANKLSEISTSQGKIKTDQDKLSDNFQKLSPEKYASFVNELEGFRKELVDMKQGDDTFRDNIQNFIRQFFEFMNGAKPYLHSQNTDTLLPPQEKDLDMGGHKIVNVEDSDVATKKYVDEMKGKFVQSGRGGGINRSGTPDTNDYAKFTSGGQLAGRSYSEVRTDINVEDGATADQTGAEIKTAYEAEADTNAFTDADHTKLDGIETTADITDATNVDAAGAVMEADYNAQTILAATTDDTPAALTVSEQTVVGRITSGNIAALTVAQLQTLLFSAALPENVNLEWDNALSADGKWSGIVTKQFNGGATIPFGEIMYLKAADSEWYQAKADATATSGAVMVGMCVLATTDGAACTALLLGKIRADAKFPTFTIAAPVFISAATAGLLTSTAPTGTTNFVVRIVGHANTGDEIYFNPDSTYIELA